MDRCGHAILDRRCDRAKHILISAIGSKTKRKRGWSNMRKKWRIAVAALSAICMLGGSRMGVYAIDDMKKTDNYDGEYKNDGVVDVWKENPLIEEIEANPSLVLGIHGFSMSDNEGYIVNWDKPTEHQKLVYLAAEQEPDNDALTWWVGQNYDENLKFQYLNGIKKTGTESSVWVIGSGIPHEQKVAYFRTHDFRFNSKNVLQWWWDNVGSILTGGQTTVTDAYNYDWYMRAVTQGIDGVAYVRWGEEHGYYVATTDIMSGLANGTIGDKITYISWGGPSYPYHNYYFICDPLKAGCMVWKCK